MKTLENRLTTKKVDKVPVNNKGLDSKPQLGSKTQDIRLEEALIDNQEYIEAADEDEPNSKVFMVDIETTGPLNYNSYNNYDLQRTDILDDHNYKFKKVPKHEIVELAIVRGNLQGKLETVFNQRFRPSKPST